MSSRKNVALEDNGCAESWKKLTIFACQGFIFEIFGMSWRKSFLHQLHYM